MHIETKLGIREGIAVGKTKEHAYNMGNLQEIG
jgi:hypothetical protein